MVMFLFTPGIYYMKVKATIKGSRREGSGAKEMSGNINTVTK